MRYRIVLATVAFLFVAAVAQGGSVVIEIIPSLAPNASSGSPSWAVYAMNAMYAIEHGMSAYGDPTKPSYYQVQDTPLLSNQPMVTSFKSWMGYANPGAVFGPDFANEYGNRMHFGLHVIGYGTQFSISQLSYLATSSDPDNGLGDSAATGYWTAYSPVRIGIIHGTNGDTRLTSGSGDQLVDELIYVGAGNAYWPECTGCTLAQQQAAIDEAAVSTYAPYTFNGTYTIQGYSGSGSFQVDPVPEPSTWMLLSMGTAGLALARRRRA